MSVKGPEELADHRAPAALTPWGALGTASVLSLGWTRAELRVAMRYPLLLTDLRQSLQLLVLDGLGLLILLDDHLHLHLHRQDVGCMTETAP